MTDRVDLDPELESRLIPSDILNEICRHALDVAPEECCGLLLSAKDGSSRRVVRVTNVMTKMHVADPSAFPRDARHAYYMSEIEYFVTDAEPLPAFSAICTTTGTKILVTGAEQVEEDADQTTD